MVFIFLQNLAADLSANHPILTICSGKKVDWARSLFFLSGTTLPIKIIQSFLFEALLFVQQNYQI